MSGTESPPPSSRSRFGSPRSTRASATGTSRWRASTASTGTSGPSRTNSTRLRRTRRRWPSPGTSGSRPRVACSGSDLLGVEAKLVVAVLQHLPAITAPSSPAFLRALAQRGVQRLAHDLDAELLVFVLRPQLRQDQAGTRQREPTPGNG